MSCKRMTTLPFSLVALSPFLIFDYALISCPLCKSNTLWNSLMILGSMKNRTRQHVTYKNDNFGFLLLFELSPLAFEFDFLSLLCNTNTLRNILTILGRNVEQVEMTCCIHE